MMIWYTIFFRFLNFFLLVLFFVYVFKKYFLPNILLLIKENEAILVKTVMQQQILEENHFQLDSVIAQEQLLYDHLHEKVITWKTIVDQKKRLENEYKNQKLEEIYTKQNKKKYNIVLHDVCMDEAYKVIDELKVGFKKKYAHDQEVITFTAMVIKGLVSKKT